MIEEEKEKTDNAEDEDEDDDDDMNDDDDDDDDKGKGKVAPLVAVHREFNGSSAEYNRLAVPEGGYDEEEDCLNAEDEDYRQVGA